MSKYVVILNTPGCLPDSEDNVVECDTLTEARNIAQSMAESFRDDWDDELNRCYWRIYGNKREGYAIQSRDTCAEYVITITKVEG